MVIWRRHEARTYVMQDIGLFAEACDLVFSVLRVRRRSGDRVCLGSRELPWKAINQEKENNGKQQQPAPVVGQKSSTQSRGQIPLHWH